MTTEAANRQSSVVVTELVLPLLVGLVDRLRLVALLRVVHHASMRRLRLHRRHRELSLELLALALGAGRSLRAADQRLEFMPACRA